MSLLPVCGKAFGLKTPDGSSEIFALESTGSDVAVALGLLATLTLLDEAPASETSLAALCVTDFEYLVLSLRRAWRGPRIALGLACGHCQAASDFTLDIDQLLRGAIPKSVPGVHPDPDGSGWFTADGGAFRLPVVGDQLKLAGCARPERALAELCLDETARQRPLRRRIERAMEAMAPEISRAIRGLCPACGHAIEAYFPVVPTVVAEMRQGAASLHDDVDLIARVYHWPQTEILSLPHGRRQAYVARIRRALDQAA